MKYFLIIISIVVLAYVIYSAAMIVWRINVGKKLAQASQPFSREIPDATYKLLVIGDSTAVGTGVDDNHNSIAGQFARDFPEMSITNYGSDGLKTQGFKDRASQLGDEHFNLAIVHIGANDIFRFTSIESSKAHLIEGLEAVGQVADTVVLLTSGNIGLAPFFPRPIGWVYSWWTQKVHDEFISIANDQGVLWVPLYTTRKLDPFLKNIDESYAADLLHPGLAGYKIWYESIRTLLDKNNITLPHQ